MSKGFGGTRDVLSSSLFVAYESSYDFVSSNLPDRLFPSPKIRETVHATSINSHELVSKRRLISAANDYSMLVKSCYIRYKLRLYALPLRGGDGDCLDRHFILYRLP